MGSVYQSLNLDQPVSFNEKIGVLKLNKENLSLCKYADKLLVRDYVSANIGSKYLVPLINSFNKVEDIDYEKLPPRFIIKTNHGSGLNIVCAGKSSFDFPSAKQKLKRWMNYNSFYLTREYQYKNITPAIIIEDLLSENVADYKFFCTNGQPVMVQVDIDRFTCHKRLIYDINWVKQPYNIRYETTELEIPRPAKFEEMLDISRKLSAPFKFVRVDLYLHNQNIYFGELTFSPGGGVEPFNPTSADTAFGMNMEIHL